MKEGVRDTFYRIADVAGKFTLSLAILIIHHEPVVLHGGSSRELWYVKASQRV